MEHKRYLEEDLSKIVVSVFFPLIKGREDEFLAHWQQVKCKTIFANLQDYGNLSWVPLFAQKELEVPVEVIGKAGWKIVVRNDGKSLEEEGQRLRHCVGGYVEKCLFEESHIISIVDESGRSLSTVEIKTDSYRNTISVLQHKAEDDNEVSEESKNVLLWFLDQVKAGFVEIDFDAIRRQEIVAKEDQEKLKMILYCGFDPFDDRKFAQVLSSFKNPLTQPFLREALAQIMALQEVELTVSCGGRSKFALTQKEVEKPVSIEELSKRTARNRYQQEEIISDISRLFHKIIGDDIVAEHSVSDPSARPRGEIKIIAHAKNKSAIESKLQNIEAFKDKIVCEEVEDKVRFTILMQPIPIAALLKGYVEKSCVETEIKEVRQDEIIKDRISSDADEAEVDEETTPATSAICLQALTRCFGRVRRAWNRLSSSVEPAQIDSAQAQKNGRISDSGRS